MFPGCAADALTCFCALRGLTRIGRRPGGRGYRWRRRMSSDARAKQRAAEYLERLGYAVLDRNWRCDQGEIDIVACQGDDLVVRRGQDARGTGYRASVRGDRRPKSSHACIVSRSPGSSRTRARAGAQHPHRCDRHSSATIRRRHARAPRGAPMTIARTWASRSPESTDRSSRSRPTCRVRCRSSDHRAARQVAR